MSNRRPNYSRLGSTFGMLLDAGRMNMRYVVVFISLLVLACGRSDDKSEVQVSLYGDPTTLLRGIEVRLEAPGFLKTLHGSDFTSSRTERIATPRTGTLLATVTVRDSLGTVLSSGNLSFNIRSDWIWFIDVWFAQPNPLGTCFGCMGAKAFPISVPKTPPDTMFLVWAGNSIKNPGIF